VGEIGGRQVRAFAQGNPAEVDDAFEARVREVFERSCRFEDPTTHPGYALLWRRPRSSLYWRSVRGIVSIEEALAAAAGCGRVRGYKEGRGRIGALAAASWRPRDRTYEVLAYRERSRWGTVRDVEEASVVEMDRRFPSTFNNYDADNRHVVLAPHSPCPVLLGIRGDVPDELPIALASLKTEPVDRWLLFETNQGTDDHLMSLKSGFPTPRTSVSIEGQVASFPESLAGGHVVFSLRRREGTVDCAAYEPSKQLRRTVRSLRPGDFVRVCGGVRVMPRTINIEKLQVVSLSPGRRAIATGWYEPPASARRHLMKPLKRFART
jgi:tRNA(Ile2)-agmatinylcytidine synthase